MFCHLLSQERIFDAISHLRLSSFVLLLLSTAHTTSTMSNPYQSSRPDESHMPPRQPPKPTDASEYLCGGELQGGVEADRADCGAKTQIKMGELIRCRECGHRVMYKPRTHKSEL